ncbi:MULTISPECIES: ABC exporter membrane fusion protein [Calothrix]|uniref:ABC exporter membrane fusion protein n=2 Tax=Calothrix TaxID=1186 RepID=A0ABR8AEK4_9CYAN|nr:MULTISPECIES: HlyD family efflux transporter periplasmic adaptor subunit [Calothrix]MBD2196972.1 ABC exporter membrane fusion protein [Calothrix parietina FACHB-288]MBD2225524.1 ABC exporter membrane fusion protein [Calothrix anomala FACHB-343]
MQHSKLGYRLSPKSILRISFFISVVASLLASGISFYTVKKWRYSENANLQITAKQLPEIKTVTALGKLSPKGEIIKISATVTAQGSRVEQLLVKEGDRVKKNQVIAILDSRDRLEAALQEAQEQVKVAQANLAKTQAGAKPGEIVAQKAAIARLTAERKGQIASQIATIERLEAQVKNATEEDNRYQQLYAQGAVSASQKDSKRLNLETERKTLQAAKAELQQIQSASQQQIKEASANLEQIAEVRGVDVAAAQAEVQRAVAAMNVAKVNLQQAYVRSPQDGQVFEIHTHPGEIISDDGIINLGQTKQMYAIAEVYESDISKVQPGQKVQVINDFFPEQLQGTVDWIGLQVRRQNVVNTDPSSNIDGRVIEVRVRLDPASSNKAAKFTNMQVKVIIQL